MKYANNFRRAGAVSVLALSAVLQSVCVQSAMAEVVKTTSGTQPNLERGPQVLPPEGFVLSIDGRASGADASFGDPIRQTDVRLDRNDVMVTFDGFGVEPRLDVMLADVAALRPGEAMRFQSRINYPAFTTRGEIRLYSRDGSRLLAVTPIEPNGQATKVLPAQSDKLAYGYRVYDKAGRFDETALMPLDGDQARQISRGPRRDDGRDRAGHRAIPLRGGAVTVQVRNLMAGAKIAALGAEAEAGPDNSAVINRILPVGEHDVEVTARGVTLIRPIEIPASDWFATGVADLTIGKRDGGYEDLGQGDTIRYGRLQGYAKGHTAGGWEITASADTQEDDLKNLLRNVTERDPRSQLSRLDPDLYYATYGDDSEMRDDTPTSSGLYLKAEKEGSHLLLGDFKSSIRNTELLRNERALYGMQGVYQSRSQTTRGDARAALELYGAQPEQLPRRDQFRGTGGSSYFLSQRDVVLGSETLQVERRDPDTGRVLSRQTLTYGRDYDVNYAQGLVMLKGPLSSFARDGGFMGGSDQDGLYLIVQYEHTPLFEDLDGYAYGGRAEVWALDRLRLGVTGSVDDTGTADQTATGADLRLELGTNSRIQLETAQTDGPGFSSSFSADGGMTVADGARVAGKGRATRLDAELDLADLGLEREGNLTLSYETRGAGFATIDRQTEQDEVMGEIALATKLDDKTGLTLSYSHFDEEGGDQKTEIEAALSRQLSEATTIELGYRGLDRFDTDRADRSGKRQDLGLRLSHKVSDTLTVYGYGIGSVSHEGGIAKGDRLGLGAQWQMSQYWSLGAEVSDGDAGQGAQARLGYDNGKGDAAYVGYALDPERDGEDDDLIGRDGGKMVWGGRKALGADVALINENSYDMFGEKRSLTSSYGMEYRQSSHLTHELRYEYGRVHDSLSGDVDRDALSFGSRYDNKDGLALRGRIELRRDQEQVAGRLDSVEESVLVSGDLRYDINDSRRLTAHVDLLRSNDRSGDSGDYTDINLGYALRPVEHDRWTLLAKYQYKYDLYGQVVNGSESRGPRQRSHVFSLDGSYRVSDHWTLGGKIGGRWSETQKSGGDWRQNDAWLGVINARYHLPNKWDLLLEGRQLTTRQPGTDQQGFLIAGYKHVGEHALFGAGYNFSSFSDDLTDMVYDDKGIFLNLVLKY